MKEIYPGVHAVQGKLGPRWLIQYILAGERTLLIDTGVKGSASSDIYPYMESVGLGPGSLDYVLISHADVDHFGDNATIKRDHPKAVLLCHTLDREMVESSAFILKNRYGWYEKHDLAYPEETFRWLGDVINADIPVDMTLSGGEWIHLSAGWSVQVLHLPGHTPGHLGVWDPKHEAAYISDAVMGYGLLNREGRIISPPPYFDVEGYRGSVRKLIDLNPSALYTAHYPPMKGREVNDFLAASSALRNAWKKRSSRRSGNLQDRSRSRPLQPGSTRKPVRSAKWPTNSPVRCARTSRIWRPAARSWQRWQTVAPHGLSRKA